MSLCSMFLIMERIKTAPKESPIAVFTGGGEYLDARFATTAATRAAIVGADPRLVGVFTGDEPIAKVRHTLETAINRQRRGVPQ